MKNKRVYFFLGTTAELIKLAPVIRELKARKIKFKLITSGQNKIDFEDLENFLGQIKADIAFPEKSHKSSMPLFLLWALKTFLIGLVKLRSEFKGLNGDSSYFIIHGDTVSSLIGSLIAKIYRLKLVHVESGLRSFNFLEPFPEEISRFIIIRLADILFAPNDWALNNLKNLSGAKVSTKQNTLIESFWWAIKKGAGQDYREKFKKYYILYIRRQEHIFFQKEWTENILELVIKNADKDLNCLFAINILNTSFVPSIELYSRNKQGGKVIMVPKLPYVDFMGLMNNAEFIATDGCTNQEEAYYMGLPCLALRNRTERVEGLGENVVISKGDARVIKDFLKNYRKYKRVPVKFQKKPSKIIVDYLLEI